MRACAISRLRRAVVLVLSFLAAAAPVSAWDEEGHILVTELALARLPDRMPAWLKSPDVRARLDYLSSEPDRWRGQHSPILDHINNPDHYIDEELLHPYGLSLKSLPLFRGEFTNIMATRRAQHPDKFPAYDRDKDASYTRLSPGTLPYAIAELQWKTAGCWTTLKTYEKHPDLVTPEMVRNARENIVYNMGVLSHFAADGAQPLHITEHHHGWVGPNPKGYTTEHGFHEYIDSGVLEQHQITTQSLIDRALPPPAAYEGRLLEADLRIPLRDLRAGRAALRSREVRRASEGGRQEVHRGPAPGRWLDAGRGLDRRLRRRPHR